MKTCDTCQKKTPSGKSCKVLNKMIGKTNHCWAWSDDPEWEQKVKSETKNYLDCGRGLNGKL
jgi:hypothetical protein